MKGNSLEISKKRNAAMIDLVFGLMFDILWLSPYDRRRQEPPTQRFERCARQMVIGLRAADVEEMTEGECDDIKRAAAELIDSVEQMKNTGIISSVTYSQASEQVQRLIFALNAAITCDETPNR